DAGGAADSTYGETYYQERLIMGTSMTNLTSSSGMPSVSSLSGSVMTVYSGDFANVEVQGSIQFSINYIQRLREFHIFVAECRNLAAVDPKRGRSDYVKSYLAPDKANLGKRKTSVKKKTLNPTFNEILIYRVRMEYLRTQTLILSVWHHDTFGKNSFLGEVDVDLSKWDFDHTQMNYLALKARLAPSNDRGEMKVAIRFLPQITHSPSTGEIHIWVKECKNLPLIRATIDPYVFMLPDTSRKSRQKTRVLRRTVDPVFNHTMVYDGIREADLTQACVELTVWDRDRLASNLLGGLRLGTGTRSYGAVVDWMDSSLYEAALWERMMASPNEWVEAVLPLRMLNSAKTAFK
uniref:C2 domain-containing protein n=1 Tax=Amphilophus citrinellus TaxID=61819 RepID=A0A3Q0RIA3_AMPCI